ncbi:NAD(P)/FAD-dependent oxidoreductase [Actinomycetospora sp. NBRC 106378]|uniref:flavin-containing monooxygenase n=1 Tax=Actinomycetospora sp. NBRC 106378 TaxID=3032208 RepID=UPI0024A4F6FB|nr:NAD(P)/FAD-dependent oxidoreductase [Actinomycetospora sp. NBRC 106378]GLZ55319.1 putative (cyclohexanone) monooxygenase [Actinomycetospora sp. NBRC 106378]
MRQVDMLVVGAGFAGLRTLHTFRERGLEVAVVEANDGLGGVWYVNRYPGARCDVESYDYSLSFSPELEQEWRWSERYATQPEILRYVDHVAERFDLRRDVHLSTRMTRAAYDEDAHRWTVTTEGASAGTWSARYLVMATGQLSVTKQPQLEGQEDFRGRILHTGAWPHEEVDLSGQRVGVIGTGSSGTQLIPVLARQVERLTVFQRTPNFSIPANNAPLSDERDAEVKATYADRRERARWSPSGLGFKPNKQSAVAVSPEERRALYEEQWTTAGFGFLLAFYDLMLDEEANDTAADFIRAKIAEKVDDPATAERLMPRGYPFGAKRPPVDSGYFETFNRENVDLVDMRETPLDRITERGIRTTAEEIELDTIVFATGFDAMTGALLKPEIVGRGGRTLREHWNAGPRTYLGVGVSGFPNFFVIAGPGSPSLLSNVLLSIEAHVDWIAGLLDHAAEQGADEIEASEQAEARWVDHVNERAAATLYPRAASYYMGAEVPGKPRVFMPYVGGVRGYRRTLEQVVADGYEGFTFTGSLVGAR